MPTIKGKITDENGLPAARVIRLYRRDTGAFLGEASSDAEEVTPPTLLTPTTFDPSNKGVNIVLTDGNTGWSSQSPNRASAARTVAKASTGKWYVEFSVSDVDCVYGICSASHDLEKLLGGTAGSLANIGGYTYNNGTAQPPYTVVSPTTGIIAMLLDLDSSPRTMRYVKGATTAGPYTIPWSGDVYIAAGDAGSSALPTNTLNAGQSAFVGTVPAGYSPGFGEATLPYTKPLGDYIISTGYTGEVQRVVLDDAPLADPSKFNDLIDRVYLL